MRNVGTEQAGEHERGGLALVAVPQRRAVVGPGLGRSRNRLGDGDVGCNDLGKRPGRTRSFELDHRLECGAETLDEIVQLVPVLGGEAHHRAMAPGARGRFRPCATDGIAQARETAPEVGRSQRGKLEIAGPAADIAGSQTDACQRMLEERHQLCGGKPRLHGIGHQLEERAGHRFGERPARGVVDPDAPRLQPGGHAPGEQAIGRNEGRGPSGRLESLAQDQRHDLGLVLGGRRLDQSHVVECPG